MFKRENYFDLTLDFLMVIVGIVAIATAAYGVTRYENLGIVFGCIAIGCIGLLMLLEGGADLYWKLKREGIGNFSPFVLDAILACLGCFMALWGLVMVVALQSTYFDCLGAIFGLVGALVSVQGLLDIFERMKR